MSRPSTKRLATARFTGATRRERIRNGAAAAHNVAMTKPIDPEVADAIIALADSVTMLCDEVEYLESQVKGLNERTERLA